MKNLEAGDKALEVTQKPNEKQTQIVGVTYGPPSSYYKDIAPLRTPTDHIAVAICIAGIVTVEASTLSTDVRAGMFVTPHRDHIECKQKKTQESVGMVLEHQHIGRPTPHTRILFSV